MSNANSITLTCEFEKDDTLTLLYIPEAKELTVEVMTNYNKSLKSITLSEANTKNLYAFIDAIVLGDMGNYAELREVEPA